MLLPSCVQLLCFVRREWFMWREASLFELTLAWVRPIPSPRSRSRHWRCFTHKPLRRSFFTRGCAATLPLRVAFKVGPRSHCEQFLLETAAEAMFFFHSP